MRLSVKNSIVFMIVGLLVFILYLYYFVGFNEILVVIKHVDPVQYSLYYSLTIGTIILSVLLYSMVWRELLRVLSIKVKLKKIFLYCWLGNFVDLVVPFETVSGELTRAYFLHNEIKEDFGKTAASLVVHRIISIFTTLSGLVVSSLYLIYQFKIEPLVLYVLVVVAGGTAATILLLLYLSAKEEAANKVANILIGLTGAIIKNPPRLANIKEKATHTLSVFHEGVEAFGKKKRYLVKPVIYSYLSWFLYLIIYFLVFYALGFKAITLYVFQMMIVFSIILAVQTTPIALPVGPLEIVMTSLYNMLLGSEYQAISGTATLLIRVVTYWFPVIVGYILIQWIGIKHLVDKSLSQI